MSETKFTPGEWATGKRRGSWDWVVFQKDGARPLEICQMFHDGTPENEQGEANARLIAAAPDLYEACRAFTDLDKTASTPEELSAQWQRAARLAKAALQKADGE